MGKSNKWLLLSLLLVFTAFHSAIAQESKKTAYGVLVDNTLSLKKQFPQVLRLGGAFITHAHQRGPIILFNFQLKQDAGFFGMYEANDTYEGRNHERASGVVGVNWTQDEKPLRKYLETLTVARGNTDLLGAIHSMAEALDASVNARKDAFEDKIIILITDGEHRMETMGGSPDDEDYRRKKAEQDLIRKMKEGGITIFAVGLLQDLTSYSGRFRLTTRERAESFLKRITKETDGRVVFPKSKELDVDEVVMELLQK
jgi:hypothetical protein